MITPGPLPNTHRSQPAAGDKIGHWTIVGPGAPQRGLPSSDVICICGTARTLQNRLLVGGEARSRSCGCRRGEAVSATRAADPDSAGDPRPIPPNGYAVALAGSVRGEKWAASSPESADPWYVGPRETECALRFATRTQAREWIGRRRVSVRYPGEMTVVPLAFSDQAPRWLPVPLLQAMAGSPTRPGVDTVGSIT